MGRCWPIAPVHRQADAGAAGGRTDGGRKCNLPLFGMSSQPKLNFAAGPAKLPQSVLHKASLGIMDYEGSGVGVMELSHRGAEFKGIIGGAEANLRALLSIPDNYRVLFMQGGGTTQFSCVPLNLLGSSSGSVRRPPPSHASQGHGWSAHAGTRQADYIVTGSWSKGAAAEAAKYGTVRVVHPPPERWAAAVVGPVGGLADGCTATLGCRRPRAWT